MINYSSMPTLDLLDRAQELRLYADGASNQRTRQDFLDELVTVDAELDSRVPTEELRTLTDESGQPVGFEVGA